MPQGFASSTVIFAFVNLPQSDFGIVESALGIDYRGIECQNIGAIRPGGNTLAHGLSQRLVGKLNFLLYRLDFVLLSSHAGPRRMVRL
jgi:hypothetical protein